MSCDEKSCYQVLLVLTEFYYDRMSKEEARSIMDGLLLDVPLPYVAEAQVIVDKIYQEDQEVELVETNVVEVLDISEVPNGVISEEYQIQDTASSPQEIENPEVKPPAFESLEEKIEHFEEPQQEDY